MNSLYSISIIKEGTDLCASDLQKRDAWNIQLNLDHVESLTDVLEFHLPITGTYVSSYALVTMASGKSYYIRPKTHELLSKQLADYDNIHSEA